MFGAVAGIVAGERLGPGDGAGAITAGLVLLVVACVVRRRMRAIALLVLVLCAGCALMQRALHGLAHWPLTPAVAERADAVLDLTLVDDPDGNQLALMSEVALSDV